MKFIDEYYNKHSGKPGFVIGGGPSLLTNIRNKFDFDRLKKQGIVIGTNKAYKLLVPHYLWFSDNNFWKMFKDEIIDLECTKFFPAEYQQEELGWVNDDMAVPVLVERTFRSKNQLVPKQTDGRLLITGGSGTCGLRLALYFGLNPIYLLGMDCHPAEDGTQHFHNDYDDMPWNLATPEWYDRSYEVFRVTFKLLEEEGVEVISCSKTSRLNDLIPYKSLTSICKKTTNAK